MKKKEQGEGLTGAMSDGLKPQQFPGDFYPLNYQLVSKS